MYTELQLTRAIRHDEEILRDPNTPPQERRTIQQRIRDRRTRLAARQKDRQPKPMTDDEFDSLTLEEYLARYPISILKILLPAGRVPERFRGQAQALVDEDRRQDLLALCPAVASKCSDHALQAQYEALVAEAREAQAKEAIRGKV